MARPPEPIRAQLLGDRYRIAYVEEGRWHMTPETDRAKALAWARRNKSRFLDAAPSLELRPFMKGFFDEGGAWHLRMLAKRQLVGDKPRREYGAIIRNYLDPLFGDRDPRALSAREIEDAVLAIPMGRYGNPLSSATKYRIMHVMGLVVQDLAERRIIDANPLVGLQPFSKAPEAPRDAIPREVLARLFPAGHGPLVRVWGKTMWCACMCVVHDTGMRPIELQNLRWDDVYKDDRAVIVRRPKRGRRTRDGKAVGVVRAAHLSARTLEELDLWKAETPYPAPSDLVLTLTGDKPVSGASIVKCLRHGLKVIKESRDEWTTYWLRHSFVTYALADLTPAEVAELAGHSVAIAEGTYSHPDDRVILERTRVARGKLDAVEERGTE